MLFCSFGYVLLPSASLWANPVGEQVVGGAATFQRQGNSLTVNQATDRLAVNWQSFNIAAGEKTHFNMPSSSSVALNRVLGGNPSSIYGSLSANGILYLVNPNGILVGPGGTIDVGAFTASTSDINPAQFMQAGKGVGMNLTGNSLEPIINQGSIRAEKGDIYLIAQKVENRGTISAPNGTAAMVGTGDKTEVILHEVGGSGFAVRVTQLQGDAAGGSNHGLPDGEELLNEGEISAAQAELIASGNIYAAAIKNSGTIRAKGVVANSDGTVRLDGGLGDVINTGRVYARNAGEEATASGGTIEMTGRNVTASPESYVTAAGGQQGGDGGSVKFDSQDTTIVQGKVDVAAPSAGAKGGKVELLGERVGLLDGAKVDASGGAGGGTVLVGGDYLGGRTPSADLKDLAKQEAEPVKNAKATVMADTAEIKADATLNGDGGKITLWSDEYTGFFGDLFARGGTEGGNGGFIETSSKDNLQAMGVAVASAANGKAGLWLLDPANVEIAAGTLNGSFNSGTPNTFTPDNTGSATASATTIQNSLNGGTSVTILTGTSTAGQAGNITMSTGISKTAGADATLTMIAAGSINISQAITSSTGGLSLVLGAGSGVTIGANLTTLGGNITIQGSNAAGSATAASTTTVTINSGTISTLGGTGLGNLSISATGAVNQTGGTLLIKGTSSVTTTGAAITLTQAANDFTGAVSLNNTLANNVAVTDANAIILGTSSVGTGTLGVTAGGSISQTGAIVQTAGAGNVTFTTTSAGSDILMASAANDFSGTVIIGTPANVRDFALRNINAGAGAVTGLGNATTTSLRDLTITYNNVAYQVPTFTTVTSLRNIAITAGGAITQAAGGVVQGVSATSASFTTGAFGITLTDPLNNFTGAVSLNNTGANNVAVTDQNAIILGTSSVGTGTLTINAVGITQATDSRIIQSAAAGLVTLNAGAGVINLTGSFNDFTGNVILSNSGANNVAVTDANSLSLGTSAVGTGTLTVTATQNISQAGTITQTAGGGLASFNTGAGSITLNNLANAFTGAVSLNNSAAYDATLVNSTGLTLGNSLVGGNYSVTANTGNITDSGNLTVAGTAAFNANAAGATITLDSSGNAFTGAVTFAGSGGLGNVVVVNSIPLVLGASTLGANFAATFAPDSLHPEAVSLSQTGALNVTGTTTLTPSAEGADIDLSTQANNLTGVLTVANLDNVRDFKLRNTSSGATAPNVAGMKNLRDLTLIFNNAPLELQTSLQSSSVRDVALTANSLILGGATASGTYDATALTGNITQSGSLLIAGDASFTAPTGASIALTASGNSFTGGVRFLSSGILANVSVVDTTAFDIQSGLSINGNFFLSANGITQSGAMITGGTTNLNGGTGAVNLPLANSYGGLVTVSGGSSADLFLPLSAETNLGPVTVDGTFTLRSASGVGFKLGGSGGTVGVFDIEDTQLSQFTVNSFSIVATAADISNSSTFNFAGIDNLSLTTVISGNISLTGALTVGALNISAVGGVITANNAANDLSGLVNASTTGASSISLADKNDLTLGIISTGSGDVSIAFGKNILTNAGVNLEGRIVTTGNLDLTPNVTGTDIILGASSGNANDIGGTITLNNANNVRDFVLRNVSSAAGDITGLGTAANLRDVSINYPVGTYNVPTFSSTSLRDLLVYAQNVILGGDVISNNGSIELYQADALTPFTVDHNVSTLSGDIRLLSDGNLAVDVGVVIGGQTSGAITLFADAGGLGTGVLTLDSSVTVGNAKNSNVIKLQAVSLAIDPTASILQGEGTVVLQPSTLVADVDLGNVTGGTAPFSIDSVAFGRIFSSGIVQIGAESQVGNINIGELSLTSNTFSTLKLVGSSASSALLPLATPTSWRTFGIGLDFDINVDLGDSTLVIDTTQAGFYPVGADIHFRKQVDGDRTLANDGAQLSLTAGTSSVTFDRAVGSINPLAFLQVTDAGNITTGRITSRAAGLFGHGGLISLTGDNIFVLGNLNADAVTVAPGIGDAGGQVLITGRNVDLHGKISVNGGDGVQSPTGTNFPGGAAGDIFIKAGGDLIVQSDSNLDVQGSFSALGGNPTAINLAFGPDGTVDLTSGRDMAFKVSQYAQREVQYIINAGRNLIFAANPDLLTPKDSVGGVFFQTNVGNNEILKTPLVLSFDLNKDPLDQGILFMAPGSSIQTNGGLLEINGEGGGITLANIDVMNSPSFNLTYAGSAELRISGSIYGQNDVSTSGVATDGAVITISAPKADLFIDRGATVAGNDYYGTGGGYLTLVGRNVTVSSINASGGIDGDFASSPGQGGTVKITANYDGTDDSGVIDVGTILAGGGNSSDTFYGGIGGIGGVVDLRPGNGLVCQYINVQGGNSTDTGSQGGKGGQIKITSGRDMVVPTGLYAGGGLGDIINGSFGEVTIKTTASGADIAMQDGTVTITGNANLNIQSSGSVIFGVIDGYKAGKSFDKDSEIVSGTNLTINEGSAAGDLLGALNITYGTADENAMIVMPGSNTIRTFGGNLNVLRSSLVGPSQSGQGGVTLGIVDTSINLGRGGSVVIDTNQGLLDDTGANVSVGNIYTSGSDASVGSSLIPGGLRGFDAGRVQISGATVSVARITSTGGGTSVNAPNNASGGQGGAISLHAYSASSNPTITLSRSLNASGGIGLGTGDAFGGSGGLIKLVGNVSLSSGSSGISALTFNSDGGTGTAGGDPGAGGAITVTGSLSGTKSSSNILNLTHGSGQVTLGSSSTDLITLGTLVTASDNATSTGNVVIKGNLALGSLTTFARDYGVEINGGGTISNAVVLNNSGDSAIGNSLLETVFTGGLDATVPATIALKGNIVSGSSSTPGTGSPLAFGVVVLADNVTLNSNGSNVNLAQIDGGHDLTFGSGIGSGVVDISSAVGSETRVGTITVSSGISQPVIFRDSVTAVGLASGSDTSLKFFGNVDLTGAAVLNGITTLDNTLYDTQSSTFFFTVGAASTFGGAVTLMDGPIEMVSSGVLGSFTFNSTVDGAINLALSGDGTKTFNGTVGGATAIGTGVGAAIAMSGGAVEFAALNTASGITSTDADVTFGGDVSLAAGDTASSLDGDVTISGVTLSSGGAVGLGGVGSAVTMTGTSTLAGSGAYTINGAVTGADVVFNGSGAKSFVSTANVASFSQSAGSGTVSFLDDVTTTGASNMAASTVLADMIFTAGGATTMNGVTLTAGGVTLQGVGNYTFTGAVNGAQTLALNGAGTKIFASTANVAGITQAGGAGTVTFRDNVTTSGLSALGAATVLDGMTFTAGGATTMNGVTLASGPVTLRGAGNYTVNGALAGSQTLSLNDAGTKTFASTANVTGFNQADGTGLASFQGNVTTSGASTFNSLVSLGTITFNAGGSTVLGNAAPDLVTLSGAVTLQGGGAYTVNGAVVGGQDLTLAGAGAKAFRSSLNLGTFTQTGTQVSLGSAVTTTGLINLASMGTTANVQINSTAANQIYGTVALAGNLSTTTTSADLNAVRFGVGGVTGAGNVIVQAAGLALDGTVSNRGRFDASTTGLIDLGVGYLTTAEVGRIRSTAGAGFTSTLGNVTAQSVTVNTSLSLQSDVGLCSVNGVTVNGGLSIEAAGAAKFDGSVTSARSLALQAQKVSSDGVDGTLANISIPSLGGLTLTGSGEDLRYQPIGNASVSGTINLAGGDVVLAPTGNFFNNYRGNPFSGTVNSVKIVSRNLFGSWPNNAAVPGLSVVYGVNDVSQLSDNQIGIANPLLASPAAPYILEFTTGTGQPYILASQAASAGVSLPPVITGEGGFGREVTYSEEEVEMMTPAERANFENLRRQRSARVILQRTPGQPEEIGVPLDGQIPQAANPEKPANEKPTAQSLPKSDPMAEKNMRSVRGVGAPLFRTRAGSAFVLRTDEESQSVLESERMTAEVNLGSAPVAKTR